MVAAKIEAYLHHKITLAQLVDWAEEALREGEFAGSDAPVLSEIAAKLGVADVRDFGLTWEDCEDLLRRLGYSARIELIQA